MQTVNIDITREYIYEYVTTLTGALGRQKEAYEKYVCLPDNYPVLDRFMDTAIAVVEASLWRKLDSTHNLSLKRKSDITVTVIVANAAFPEQLHGAVCTNIRLALAYILTGMWLQGIDPDFYAHYAGIADKYISNASVMAGQRSAKDILYGSAQDDSVDCVSAAGKRTGKESLQDSVVADSFSGKRTGQQPLQDGCINKHSAFDHAILYPDGTVMSL